MLWMTVLRGSLQSEVPSKIGIQVGISTALPKPQELRLQPALLSPGLSQSLLEGQTCIPCYSGAMVSWMASSPLHKLPSPSGMEEGGRPHL